VDTDLHKIACLGTPIGLGDLQALALGLAGVVFESMIGGSVGLPSLLDVCLEWRRSHGLNRSTAHLFFFRYR
jgi:hypothetical protein